MLLGLAREALVARLRDLLVGAADPRFCTVTVLLTDLAHKVFIICFQTKYCEEHGIPHAHRGDVEAAKVDVQRVRVPLRVPSSTAAT